MVSDTFLGALAIQLGYCDAQQVAEATAPGQPLLQRLVQQQALDAVDAQKLLTLAEELTARHSDIDDALHPTLPTPVSAVGQTMISSPETSTLASAADLSDVSREVEGRYSALKGPTGAAIELGRGGIGVVTLTHDRFVGRQVALKQLLPQPNEGHQSLAPRIGSREQRFLREARVTAQLEHPSIVPVYEIGTRADGSLYYVMRRIDGRTMSEEIAQTPELKKRLLLLSRFLNVCQAIAYAHSHSVIHRDIKPQNVMLGRFGETYVLDWGLARVRGRVTGEMLKTSPEITGAIDAGVIGTPAYMSPEQANGELSAIDERSDVYGLGAVMYELLTGKTPYAGESGLEVVARIRTDPWTPVRTLQPDVPQDLAAICEKALSRDKNQRYANASGLAEDLEHWLQGRRVSAYRYSTSEVVGRWVSRYRLPLQVAGIALGVLLMAGLWSWNTLRRERNEARQFTQFVLRDVVDALPGDERSTPVTKALTERALSYYTKTDHLKSLSDSERASLGNAFNTLASLNRTAGEPTESRRLLELCFELFASEPSDELHAELVLAEANCRLSRAVLGRQVGDADAGPLIEQAMSVAERAKAHWKTPEWWVLVSTLQAAEARHAYENNDAAKAEALLKSAVAIDSQLSQADEIKARAAYQALSNRQMMELVQWALLNQPGALEIGDRAVKVGRAQPGPGRSTRFLSALGSTERQHGMLLSWSPTRAHEAEGVLKDAESVLREALKSAPGDMPSRGELADALLEQGRPEDALAESNQLHGELSESYLVSEVVALTLSGKTAETLAKTDQVKADGDVTLRLMRLLALLREGQQSEAKALVPGIRTALIEQQVVWPRASIRHFAEGSDAVLKQALLHFDLQLEKFFYDQDDASGQAAFDEFVKAMNL